MSQRTLPAELWTPEGWRSHNQFRIDPTDEGLLFGRGIFTTTRTVFGRPFAWPAHVARMQAAAQALDIPLPDSQIPGAEELREWTARQKNDVVLRWTVTAGSNHGTDEGDFAGGSWVLPRPLPPQWESVALRIERAIRVSPSDPFTALKTLHYGVRTLSLQRARDAGADLSILLDPSDQVLEASVANLFLRIEGTWVTPAGPGVLEGIVRGFLLERLPGTFSSRPVPLDELMGIDAAFITNSVRGIVPVSRIEEQTLPPPPADVIEFQRLLWDWMAAE